MQKWKQALRIDGRLLSSTEGVLGAIAHDLKGLRGKWVRITVEEIVNDQGGGVADMADPVVIEFDEKHKGKFEIFCPALGGKPVRVTVEEIPNKCCEKWRKMTAQDKRRNDGGRCLLASRSPSVGPIIFCPECGRKL